uniref:Uncharacterized protein n=1 Tax=Oryza barthii TaxID=65489 RepID=A0A0D3GEW2_9ORYZ
MATVVIRRRLAAVVAAVLLIGVAFLAVSGEAARPLGGVVQLLLRQMYLQRLAAGPSCGTNSSNGGCPHRPRSIKDSDIHRKTKPAYKKIHYY